MLKSRGLAAFNVLFSVACFANLANGQHNPHSPLEWACLEQMVGSAQWLVALAEVWAQQAR